jgi:FtsP/CotA-like multicopper oxidase with cupredoxin domain
VPGEAGGAIVNVDVDLLPFRIPFWICLFFVILLPARAETADQVCAHFAAGSATTAPPELESQNGVLEVTMKFLTATDSQGLVRYCYVTDTGLQEPTLRVSPGDQLIIHFQNDLPAAANNMAGMKMSLSPHDSSSTACNGNMSATATNIHFHGIDPGTPKGTYTVVVTGTAGSGSSLPQTRVNVPNTIQ